MTLIRFGFVFVLTDFLSFSNQNKRSKNNEKWKGWAQSHSGNLLQTKIARYKKNCRKKIYIKKIKKKKNAQI